MAVLFTSLQDAELAERSGLESEFSEFFPETRIHIYNTSRKANK